MNQKTILIIYFDSFQNTEYAAVVVNVRSHAVSISDFNFKNVDKLVDKIVIKRLCKCNNGS